MQRKNESLMTFISSCSSHFFPPSSSRHVCPSVVAVVPARPGSGTTNHLRPSLRPPSHPHPNLRCASTASLASLATLSQLSSALTTGSSSAQLLQSQLIQRGYNPAAVLGAPAGLGAPSNGGSPGVMSPPLTSPYAPTAAKGNVDRGGMNGYAREIGRPGEMDYERMRREEERRGDLHSGSATRSPSESSSRGVYF